MATMQANKDIDKRLNKEHIKNKLERYDWDEFPVRIKSKKQARRHRKK
ncbi:hypothetical protein KFE96_00155 [Kordiimonas sp. SCSIO 12603]|nr:hypothetical protein [Kordiimonas sp. SCSIO 12603]UTW58754.1 hypothetical protein KFE96_00155 [Kordiimonas sp. SCSIO 12603]